MENNLLKIEVQHEVEVGGPGDASPSHRVAEVASMFGLGADQSRRLTLIPPTRLALRGGHIVFVTGASGGGKSTLLRLIRAAVTAPPAHGSGPAARVIDFHPTPRLPRGLPPGADADGATSAPPTAPAGAADDADAALIDLVDGGRLGLADALRVLSLAGLNDAFVMLRRPGELSDGQRHRFDLARAMAEAEATASPGAGAETGAAADAGLVLVLADEFGATLDRTTVAALARNVRRWVSRQPRVCFVAATTHDDLLEPLEPDVLIEKQLGGGLEIATRAPASDVATMAGGRS